MGEFEIFPSLIRRGTQGVVKKVKMKKYNFTKLKLSPSEKAWLAELEKWDFKSVNPNLIKVKLADKLEKGFDYRTINPMLLSSDGITLLGIWHVNQKSKYFDSSTKVIMCIRDIITSPNPKFVFKIDDISAVLDTTEEEIAVVFKLCHDLGYFSGGSGWGDHFGMYQVGVKEEGGGLDKILYF
jgi:hypothetical protein